jgi:hypothetical protein
MNGNQSQGQSQQQPGQQNADPAHDLGTPELPEGSDVAPSRGDSNRTPWQQQQPTDRPPQPQQGDALSREQQQQGSRSEDTDEADETQPSPDTAGATSNN